MRVFTFPLFKETWAFFAHHPTAAGTWDFLAINAEEKGIFWRTAARISNKVRTELQEMEDAPAGTFKHKIHQYTKKLLDVAHPDETFLKTISVRTI